MAASTILPWLRILVCILFTFMKVTAFHHWENSYIHKLDWKSEDQYRNPDFIFIFISLNRPKFYPPPKKIHNLLKKIKELWPYLIVHVLFTQHNFKNGTTISPFITVWRKWILITQEKCFANIYRYLLILTSFFVIWILWQTFPMKMFKKWCQKVKCIPAFLFNFEWNLVNGQGKTLNILNIIK